MKGHNNPPKDVAISIDVDDLFTMLSDTLEGGQVSNDTQEAAIDGMAKQFADLQKLADKERVAEKKPHDDAGKAVQAKWKPIVDKASAGRDACLKAVTPYRVKKREEEEAAARKLREEAEAKLAAAAQALQASDNIEENYEAEQSLKEAKKAAAQANKIDRGPKGFRTVWRAEVIDYRAALNHYLKLQPEAFREVIDRLAAHDARFARPAVAGLVYHEEKVAN